MTLFQQRIQFLKFTNSFEQQESAIDISAVSTAVEELEVHCKVAQLSIILFFFFLLSF